MSQIYKAVVNRSAAWWIGWIEEVPVVNCQEQAREELLETLRIALAEALELSRCEAGDSAGSGRAAGVPGGTNPTVTALGAPPVQDA